METILFYLLINKTLLQNFFYNEEMCPIDNELNLESWSEEGPYV
jgi:hypothetical protein